MTSIPRDPIFVNRRTSLQLFDDAITALEAGERRHISLLGLRRVGKTVLLDEVRARHPNACIVKIAIDTVVSTPEGFALDWIAAVLQGVLRARGEQRIVTTQVRSISTAAGLLGTVVSDRVDELLELVEKSSSYGHLLAKLFVFPAEVSDATDAPILVMLDEFQDIRKLRNFPGTEGLWGAFREALDRRGRVAYVVAGSIVTAMRALMHNGDDPLFTRFEEHSLPPFTQEDTVTLAAGVWDRVGIAWDQNAAQRVHALSQGFPFYAHVLSRGAADFARVPDNRVLGDHVDMAFEEQFINRDSQLSLYMRYLFQQAIASVRGENIPDAILRVLAYEEGRRLTDIATAIRRKPAQIKDILQELIDIDILRRTEDSTIWFVDPLLPLWIALERDRQEPGIARRDPTARPRVIEMLAERVRALREAAGPLFERQVHNIVRQFRGQTVSKKLFGMDDGTLVLPTITDVTSMNVPDPDGLIAGKPGMTEIDGITTGTASWVIEAKYIRDAVTVTLVEKLLKKRTLIDRLDGFHVDQLWIASAAGFRTDARERCEKEGIYMSGARQLRQLERAFAR